MEMAVRPVRRGDPAGAVSLRREGREREETVSPSLEIAVRVGSYAAVFGIMALWEWLAPRRRLGLGRHGRWVGNLGILVVDIVAVRLVVPLTLVGAAAIAAARGVGLFHWLGLPGLLALPLGVVALDLVIYGQHRLFHAVPLLWRLHRVHHADVDIDVTTGVRFHPFEILLSLAIKLAAVTALGVAPFAVLVFEVLLNATSMFNHGNVTLPSRLEGALRWIVVTPQMHEIHHSVERRETDSNFGFNLPWWDRLFGTYRAAPAAGLKDLDIGLPDFRDAGEQRLGRLLTQPFREPRS